MIGCYPPPGYDCTISKSAWTGLDPTNFFVLGLVGLLIVVVGVCVIFAIWRNS